MALTTYSANKLLDHMIGKTSFAMPDVFLALFTAAPTIAGGGTECAYTGYAMPDVFLALFSAASGPAGTSNASTNSSVLQFPTKTGGTDETVTHWATFDAVSGGNMLEFGTLASSKLIQTGDDPKFAIGDFDRSAS